MNKCVNLKCWWTDFHHSNITSGSHGGGSQKRSGGHSGLVSVRHQAGEQNSGGKAFLLMVQLLSYSRPHAALWAGRVVAAAWKTRSRVLWSLCIYQQINKKRSNTFCIIDKNRLVWLSLQRVADLLFSKINRSFIVMETKVVVNNRDINLITCIAQPWLDSMPFRPLKCHLEPWTLLEEQQTYLHIKRHRPCSSK